MKVNHLACEQVFEIWRTEPWLIQILDLRKNEKVENIPGALNLKQEDLPFLTIDSSKLLVCLAEQDDEESIAEILKNKSFCFVKECENWKKLNYPIKGFSIDEIFYEIKGNKIMNSDTVFFQLFEPESSTYTYIIGDKKSKDVAIIDPVIETLGRDLTFLEELGFNLRYIFDTHVHADHITSAGILREKLGAKTGVSAGAGVQCVDVNIDDGQEFLLGDKKLKAIATPGHTDSCMSFYFEGMVFTGDALLIRGCGRTDFQQGSTEKLFHSVREKLFKLPGDTIVYPAHDYKGFTSSTIELEKKFNPRLRLDNEYVTFKKIMDELKLAYPKKIDASLPANIKCGLGINSPSFNAKFNNGIPEISCEELNSALLKGNAKFQLIDVRRDEEFIGELAHINGAKLKTLGPDLSNYLKDLDRDTEIVFICRSGARSANSTNEAKELGFKHIYNLTGGMLRWRELNYKVVK